MASRSDQLHSHQFARDRLVSALVTGDADPARPLTRRFGAALFAGVMLATVALAVVGVYGVINPGPDDGWREAGAVIVEERSGAPFVYRDGVLHPMANYVSALLALGSAEPASVQVTPQSLAGVPRGALWGIPGAPDLLPKPGDLITGDWVVCSRPVAASADEVESVVFVGAHPELPARPLGDQALLAVDSDNDLHLVWRGRRYPIRDRSVVLTALGWTSQPPVPVANAVLNVLGAGVDLAAVPIPGRGGASGFGRSRAGQVFVVDTQAGVREYAVATPNGLAAITQLQADLILSDPRHVGAGAPVELSQAEFGAAPKAPALTPTGAAAPPARTPTLRAPDQPGGVCAGLSPGTAGPPRVFLGPGLARTTGEVTASRGAGVDWVRVEPGRAAVVEALATGAAPGGAVSIVSDLGVRYPLAGDGVLAMLGYRGVSPQRLPAALLALLPTGRPLDPEAARRPAEFGG